MAIHGALTDADIYYAGYDMTGVSNEIRVNASRAALKRTTFGSGGCEEYTGGLFDVTAMLGGFVEYGSGLADDQLVTALNASPQTHVLFVSPTGADGAHADFASVQIVNYGIGEKVGALLPFTANFAGRDSYGRVGGTILLPKQVLPSGTTNGTATQLGAVSSTQSLYAALQVFAVSGSSPTLDVTVKSSSSSGGSYTTRATFSQQTAAGDVFLVPVPGPFTDTWWKVSAVVGGSSSPTVTAAAAVGIR